ncbi:MAG TPA: tetratricopeptide repeat protein [Candidatus Acidoferrum sp.]|nr:tetratricopeptide repeat protein [Candidatus Acidoferrum sp.]
MTFSRLAIPTVLLLFVVIVPSSGQSTDDKSEPSAPPVPAQPVSQAPPSNTVPASLTPEELADLLMIRKEYREAAEKYKELTRQDPHNAVYMNKLGIALHQQMDLKGALKCYERAVKLNPHYADAQNNIGTIWYQRKKYGKAIRAYKKAIKLRDDMAVLYANLGYAYFGDKKYEEAIGTFRHALELDPLVMEHNASREGSVLQDRSVGDRGRFFYLLAKSFAETGNFDRSFFYLRKAKDDGYKSLNDVKSDPAFAAMMKLPDMQEVLAPPTFPLNP